jgi:hypothetical protein
MRLNVMQIQIAEAFTAQGDGMYNAAPLLTDLVNNGIRLLVYAGNAGGFSALPVSLRSIGLFFP